MKSCGYCTNNIDGNFEVSWENNPTIFTKLFRRPTKFVYWTTSKELKTDKYKSRNVGLYYDWFDSKGNKVICVKILDNISKVINEMQTFENRNW